MIHQSQEAWMNSILKINPAERIDTADGPEKWRSVLIGCLPDGSISGSLGLPTKQCLCFFGPHGSGKHSLALGFAGSVTENRYKVLSPKNRQEAQCIYVNGVQLLDSGKESAISRIETLFHFSCEGHYVLIIEEPTELCVWEKIVNECRKLERSASITVIVIESNEKVIHEEWKDALLFCRFELPDYDERISYFSRQFGKRIIRFPENDILADYTEGFSYYELYAFVNLMRLKLKQHVVNSYNSVREVVNAAQQGLVELDDSECIKCLSLVKAGRIEYDHTPEAIHVVIDGGGVMLPGAVQAFDKGDNINGDKKVLGTEALLPEESDEEKKLRLQLGEKILFDVDEKLRQEGFS